MQWLEPHKTSPEQPPSARHARSSRLLTQTVRSNAVRSRRLLILAGNGWLDQDEFMTVVLEMIEVLP